jgi:hypothetical protein
MSDIGTEIGLEVDGACLGDAEESIPKTEKNPFYPVLVQKFT